MAIVTWNRDWRWVAPHWRLWIKHPIRCFKVWAGLDGTYKRRSR